MKTNELLTADSKMQAMTIDKENVGCYEKETLSWVLKNISA